MKDGDGILAIGMGSGQNIVSGSRLTIVGNSAGAFAENLIAATALGFRAMANAGVAVQNTAIGDYAPYKSMWKYLRKNQETNIMMMEEWESFVVSGTSNVAVGPYALMDTDSGFQNVAVGRSALIYNIGRGDNVGIGDRALRYNNSFNNTGVGRHTLEYNVIGENNTAIGWFAGSNNAQ